MSGETLRRPRGPSQNDRVLAHMRTAGLHGTTVDDWDRGPNTPAIDGGPRITRLHARILDLRDAGHQIADPTTRNGFKVYVLVGLAERHPPKPHRDGYAREWVCDRCWAHHDESFTGPLCPNGHDAHIATIVGAPTLVREVCA